MRNFQAELSLRLVVTLEASSKTDALDTLEAYLRKIRAAAHDIGRENRSADLQVWEEIGKVDKLTDFEDLPEDVRTGVEALIHAAEAYEANKPGSVPSGLLSLIRTVAKDLGPLERDHESEFLETMKSKGWTPHKSTRPREIEGVEIPVYTAHKVERVRAVGNTLEELAEDCDRLDRVGYGVAWLSCSGCTEVPESTDGSHLYPRHPVHGCLVGYGCEECRFEGVTWSPVPDDGSDAVESSETDPITERKAVAEGWGWVFETLNDGDVQGWNETLGTVNRETTTDLLDAIEESEVEAAEGRGWFVDRCGGDGERMLMWAGINDEHGGTGWVLSRHDLITAIHEAERLEGRGKS